MDQTIQAPDPQAMQMLMALMGGGRGTPMMPQQQAATQAPPALPPASTAPLANGQNASLGVPGSASLGTPADMYSAMMQSPIGAGF